MFCFDNFIFEEDVVNVSFLYVGYISYFLEVCFII